MRSTFFLASLVALSLSLTVLAAGCAAPQQDDPSTPDDMPAAESAQSAAGRVGAHGMVLAGDAQNAVLSHIPMYAAPHDVQLVVQGKLIAVAGHPLPATFSDRAYTFLPERTSLDALRNGVTRELRGTVYLGNFEQGGRPVASNVRFAVDHVVHQHLLVAQPAADAGSSANGDLTYLVFGSRAHAFAVHAIAAAPSFDEVLAVTIGPDAPSDAELAAGVLGRVAGTQDVAAARLGTNASSVVTLAAGAKTFTVHPITTLSCLDGPDFFAPCPSPARSARPQ